jgi:glycerol transport system ATP-binding protein
MNIVPAEVKGREARIGGHVIALNRTYDGLPSGAKIEVGVRPEFVDIATPAPDLLSANIDRIDDLGRIRFARVRVGDIRLAARVPNGSAVNGGTAGLRFDPAHVHVYADSILVEGTA